MATIMLRREAFEASRRFIEETARPLEVDLALPSQMADEPVRAFRLIAEAQPQEILAQLDPADIQAIGITYQMHGMVIVDKDHDVLRPAIICDRLIPCPPTPAKAFADTVILGRSVATAGHHLVEFCVKGHGIQMCTKPLQSVGTFSWLWRSRPEFFCAAHKVVEVVCNGNGSVKCRIEQVSL